MEISPRLAFRSEVIKAIAKYYGSSEWETTSKLKSSNEEDMRREEIEFFSTSSRQSNQEAIQEMQPISCKEKRRQCG